jgi:hypothetical protein
VRLGIEAANSDVKEVVVVVVVNQWAKHEREVVVDYQYLAILVSGWEEGAQYLANHLVLAQLKDWNYDLELVCQYLGMDSRE